MTTALDAGPRLVSQANPAADPQYLAERMWNTWQDAHRQWVLRAVETFAPSSLYELGCGSGPNLRAVQNRFPAVALRGADPFPPFAAWARAHLRDVPIDDVRVQTGLPSGYEMVLSCYVLAYVPPDEVRAALTRLRENQNLWLCLMEPTAHESVVFGTHQFHAGSAPEVTIWAHGWDRLLTATGWRIAWAWPIVPVRDGMNTVILARPA